MIVPIHGTTSEKPVMDQGTETAEELRIARETAERERKKADELAQFPLYDPSPLIRFDLDNQKLLYVNPAAFNKYSDIFLKGASHLLLAGIRLPAEQAFRERHTVTREVTVGGITYQQAITPHLMGQAQIINVYNHDITAQKKTEEILRFETERAEAANKAKGDFLANMSHELRTPMNGVLGMVSLLRETKLDKDQQELLETISTSGESLLLLLNDILDLSKIEASELTLESTPFNLHVLMRELIRLYEPMARKKGLSLEFHYNPTSPETVIGDPARVRQIVTNLIGNALKFTEKGSIRLDITSRRINGEKVGIFFRVDDTGIGIKEQYLDKIFNKFTQGDESTTRRFGGTGLGLTICKLLAGAMGGTIGVESALGKGSSFLLDIPFTLATQEQTERLQDENHKEIYMSEQIQSQFSHSRILVVDDHPVNLFFAKKLLNKFGFSTVDTADGGQPALDLMAKKPYDLIILDCQMPDMDGYEVSSIIRANENKSEKHVPIIAMTANAMVGDREKCIEAGMDDYVTKPINTDRMMEMMVKWLGAIPNHEIQEKYEPANSRIKAPDPSTYGDPVDMEHIKEYFSDEEEKSMVIGMFQRVTEESLAIMSANAGDGENENWKRAAHKLKGSAANFGANYMKDCCVQAEQLSDASALDKGQLLFMIQQAYDGVRNFLAT